MLVNAELEPDVAGGPAVLVGTGRVEARAAASDGDLKAAAADVTALLEAVRARLDLAALPPMPDLTGDLPPGCGPDLPEMPRMGLLRTILFVWKMRRAAR